MLMKGKLDMLSFFLVRKCGRVRGMAEGNTGALDGGSPMSPVEFKK